ncbi:unnamed protein product [Closterium sp. NIES-54]
MAPLGPQVRPHSPDRRSSRPHSPAPRQEQESSQRLRDSPRRHCQQTDWPAHHGGRGGWWGPRGCGSGGVYDPSVRMADLQQFVSNAMREERAA